MQPGMNISSSSRVVIMGLGLHGGGLSSARFFARCKARVLVTDTKTKLELAFSLKKLARYKNITYALGKHRKTDFARADLIIRNPAVPNDSEYLKIARDRGIPVHTDVSWFLQFLKEKETRNNKKMPIVIGITGTKGKSTTATLLHYILIKTGKKAMLAGNIRKSPLDLIKTKNESLRFGHWDLVILELSSWHLESLDEHKLSPQIALITNILPDHLNRYSKFEEYAKTKFLISTYQTKHDALFLNKNDNVSRSYSANQKNGKIIEFTEKSIKSTREPLHPVSIGAVLAIARYLKVNKKLVQKAIAIFRGLEGRLEYIGTAKGVRYYNDTCATQPDAAIFAIKNSTNTKSNLILIAGGQDKNLDYAKLALCITRHVRTVILFQGSASDKILAELKKINGEVRCLNNIISMKEAVALAKKHAEPGDAVLLAPGAASFGLFNHEFDRGEQFRRLV